MSWVQKTAEYLLGPAKKLTDSFHAIPKDNANPLRTLPSMHRLMNVVGMAGAFAATQYITNIIFGQKNDGTQIDADEVPKPLRFLHGIVKYNTFSDDPRDQWLKVVHQMLPAVGGAIGAVKGSEVFFSHHSKREMKYRELLGKENLTVLEEDSVKAFAQGKAWRVAAGMTAWFSSVSGMTSLYGIALNTAFMLCNGTKIASSKLLHPFTNTTSDFSFIPQRALEEILRSTERTVRDAANPQMAHKAEQQYAEELVNSIFVPLVKNLKATEKEQLVETFKTMFHKTVSDLQASGKKPAEISEELNGRIESQLHEMLTKANLSKLGEGLRVGQNGILGYIAEKMPWLPGELNKTRANLGRYKVPIAVAGGVGAVAVGSQAFSASKASIAAAISTNVSITPGMTAEQYVTECVKRKGADKHKGIVNGGLLSVSQTIGDMALAVIPKNRFWCAVGLTSGGFAGIKFANLLAGQHVTEGTPIKKEEYAKILQPLHGLLEFDPHSSALKDRWKRTAALATFTAVSFVGVMMGAYHAYHASRKQNEKHDSLEDFAARTAQHQGDKWRWLASSSGVLGSSSGASLLPFLPGLSYGPSIAAYTALNQDRKVMTPGLKGLSGTKTTSYLGLREGVDYLCKYAVNNPSKDPGELEFLALTVMGPLADAAGVKLSAQNIKTFVDKIHEVRDKYWQEGGIPKAKKAEAMKEMEANFKGKGLDKTLYESGIDSTRIDFAKLNGVIGKIGNALGATKTIHEDQDAYRAMVAGWRKDWKAAHSSEPAANEPYAEAANDPYPAKNVTPIRKSPEDFKKPAIAPRPASQQEAVNMNSGTGAAVGV